MRKSLFAAICSLAAATGSGAHAAPSNSRLPAQTRTVAAPNAIDDALGDDLAVGQAPVDQLDSSDIGDEPAPPPEPPFPGSEEGAYASDPSMSGKLHDSEPALNKKNWQSANPSIVTETPPQRPVRVDEEGAYIYDTKPTPPAVRLERGASRPERLSESGDYIYDTKQKNEKPAPRAGVEAPASITNDGQYQYKLPTSVSKHAASFRIGVLTPPSLRNVDNGLSYKDVYGSSPVPVLLLDYEFPIFKSPVGELAIKAGSGLMVSSGQGHFRDPARAAEIPDERFTFLTFPNTATANYRFRFARKQVFVPFVEGGAGYFTFAEIRDDAKKPKFGASPVAVASGGANFLLDWIDPAAIRQLDNDYGITHIWVTAEVRAIVGLKQDVDFTSNSANLGFIMEF